MSEVRDLKLKEQFGKLGLYLVNKAHDSIKEMNEQTLFQKGRIKKDFSDRIFNTSMELKENFKETHAQFLNNYLSSNIMKAQEYFLNLKNRLIKEFNNDVRELIKANINKKYNEYMSFLLTTIENNVHIFNRSPETIVFFNSKDFKFFKKNNARIEKLLSNKVVINESKENFIGGFKLIQDDGGISYDFTIDNIIKKGSSLIQKEFSKTISDIKINEIQKGFGTFIQEKKLEIEEHLRKYDAIR